MNRIIRTASVALVAVSFAAFAQDDEEDWQEDAADDEDMVAAARLVASKQQAQPKFFTTIPSCKRIDGVAEVLVSGETEWKATEEGRFYPLGSVYRTVGKDSRLVISFGPECSVAVAGDSSFGTRALVLGEPYRVVSLKSGLIKVELPRNLPEGLFSVAAPGFTVSNLAGASKYLYRETGDGDEAVIRCVTGTLQIDGRHFQIPVMRAANEVRIRTSGDQLFSGIYGTRGDYTVRLDQGSMQVLDIESGEKRVENRFLDWQMSPQTAVRIHRAVPDIGEKMAVSIMTFDAAGDLRNRCAFTEDTYEVNSGELAPVSKESREEIARKAAEASETETVEVDVGDEEGEDGEVEESDGEEAEDEGDELDF